MSSLHLHRFGAPGSIQFQKPGTALFSAIEHDHADIAKFLLSEGVEIGPKHVESATSRRNKEILQLFLEYGWNVNKQTDWCIPQALAYAVEDFDLSLWILTHGADPNASCMLDITPLSAAVQYGSLQVVKLLFDHGGTVKRGQLLHYAIWRDHEDRLAMVTYILSKGAPVNKLMYQDHPYSFGFEEAFGLGTPLHAAAAQGYGDIVSLLIYNGADASIKDSCGKLPYQRAEANGHGTVAQYLRSQM